MKAVTHGMKEKREKRSAPHQCWLDVGFVCAAATFFETDTPDEQETATEIVRCNREKEAVGVREHCNRLRCSSQSSSSKIVKDIGKYQN